MNKLYLLSIILFISSKFLFGTNLSDKIILYYITNNHESLKKILDNWKPIEDIDIEIKTQNYSSMLIANKEFETAYELLNSCNPKFFKLSIQFQKLLCLVYLGKKEEVIEGLYDWKELKNQEDFRIPNVEFIDISFIYYRLGDIHKALELYNNYYSRVDYYEPPIMFELYRICYLYDQQKYQECLHYLDDLKSYETDYILRAVENTKLNLWKSLLYFKISDIKKSSEYFQIVLDGKRFIELETDNKIDLEFFLRPSAQIIPSDNIINDFLKFTEEIGL